MVKNIREALKLDNDKILLNNIIEIHEDRLKNHFEDRIQEGFDNFEFAVSKGHSEFHIMYSGGKDSTTTLVLLLEYIKTYPVEKLPSKITVYFSDTKLEIPTLLIRSLEMLRLLQKEIDDHAYPVEIVLHILKPKMKDRFFYNVLGKGYVLPNQSMRWCTDRLKINPVNQILKFVNKKTGIILIGIRFGESDTRDKRIIKTCARGGECGQGRWYIDNKGMKTLAPIINARACDIWDILNLWAPSKGYFTKGLAQIYLDDTETRFGCWVCPVIAEDHTMVKLVATPEGKIYEPLLTFRDFLKDICSDRLNPHFRVKRRNGTLGRLTLKLRRALLSYLLEVQKQVGIELIEQEEIDLIRETWNDPKYNDKPYGSKKDKRKGRFDKKNYKKLQSYFEVSK